MKLKTLALMGLILILMPLPLLAQTESPWSGEGELGFLMTSGNSETESVNARLDLNYETARWRHNGHMAALYNAEETESESGETEMETSAEKYLVSAKSGYKFTENNYAFLTGTYEDDRFSGYDYQTSVSAGYGRRVVKTERMLLEMEIGPGYRYNRLNGGGEEKEGILRGFHIGEDKQEFISAHAGNGVSFPQQRQQALGYSLEKQIADIVAVGVIDLFQLVEVEEHHAEFDLVPLRAGDFHFDAFVEQPPIGQAGQGVMVSQVLDGLFGLFPVRNFLLGLFIEFCVLDGDRRLVSQEFQDPDLLCRKMMRALEGNIHHP